MRKTRRGDQEGRDDDDDDGGGDGDGDGDGADDGGDGDGDGDDDDDDGDDDDDDDGGRGSDDGDDVVDGANVVPRVPLLRAPLWQVSGQHQLQEVPGRVFRVLQRLEYELRAQVSCRVPPG